MNAAAGRIAENVRQVRERIAAAAARAGRAPNEVTLVAITKYVSLDVTAAAIEAGCMDLGESRPQDLWSKAAALAQRPVRWHMIGHLQRNKVRRTLPLVHLMQSVDSPRLLQALDDEAARQGHPVDVLLEVNVSGDASKTGLPVDEVGTLVQQAGQLKQVRVRGLMGMAAREGDAEGARADFAALRQLRDRLAAAAPPGVSLAELSMGMSGDFEQAVEEGATIVRLGSILFEGVDA
ncbi:MAG: YggS family pyridoxal phosphate-dependent enzyme [Planctomycetota bacterium]|nr:MAG: YggS family pyridoxal phosphate-dependent enzyme [Planctomycetota bacterium]